MVTIYKAFIKYPTTTTSYFVVAQSPIDSDREQRTENQKQETDRHQTENRQRTDKSGRRNNTSVTSSEPVSYTHLTLPTIA